ncbi:unnamed protein product [Caenorhabditis angaria]|uniref:DUF38 domain-containing protein n=1 Tax=Caenorhabditis angaria TaxID=860376 RepID=A0A9P1N827_9PELO|nr:unnamed protein product [Caenorhabditis angaria]
MIIILLFAIFSLSNIRQTWSYDYHDRRVRRLVDIFEDEAKLYLANKDWNSLEEMIRENLKFKMFGKHGFGRDKFLDILKSGRYELFNNYSIAQVPELRFDAIDRLIDVRHLSMQYLLESKPRRGIYKLAVFIQHI